MSWIAVYEGSGITSWPLYFGSVRSVQFFGGARPLSVRTMMPRDSRRWATWWPLGSLTSSRTLSKFFGRNGTSRSRLVEPVDRGGIGDGQHVGQDAPGVDLLQEAAEDGRAAGAEELHLDARLVLEQGGDLLGGDDRRRGVPGDTALPLGGREVDGVRA